MKKKFYTFLAVLFTLVNLLSASGSFWGEKDIRVSKTKWFDIIYTPKSESTAKILFQKADGVYEEVTAQYGITPQFRMPVVITYSVETFNAFWTVAPYNHVVIYDTAMNGLEELTVFSETLLSVFRHELTHAVTYNMKNGFWSAVSHAFGDVAVPGMFMVSVGMSEGATVTSESAAGEGRLNDEYAKQTVKQAKLEGKFPKADDVIGAGDKYPGGAPYFFYGAFHQWLQDNYGLEAYGKYWYYVINLSKGLEPRAFLKAFGIKKKAAWAKFMEDYQVPDIPGDPVNADVVQDFFDTEAETYSIRNNSGSLYTSLTASQKRIAWIDSTKSEIQYVDVSDLNNKVIKPKKLFSAIELNEISLSADGRLLAMSCTSNNTPGSTGYVKIYDMDTKQTFTVKQKSLKGAAIIVSDGEYYLAANHYVSPNNTIYLAKINFNNDRIASTEEIAQVKEPLEQFCNYFTGLSNGKVAYIKKDKMEYSICISSIDGTLVAEIKAPKERMVIRYLSAAQNDLYFSWAEPGTMPRVGKVSLETGVMTLDSQDISGGVYSPVYAQGKLIYLGNFYRQNRILAYDNSFASAEEFQISQADVADQDSSVDFQLENQFFDFDLEYTKYNPLNYMKRGILIPISTYKTEYFGCNSLYDSDLGQYISGATYLTSNPWSSGTNDLFQFTAGWNFLNSSVGLEADIKQSTDTPLLSTLTTVKTEFDADGWKLSSGDFQVASQFDFGRNSYIRLTNQATARIGRQDRRNLEYDSLALFTFWDTTKYGALKSGNNTVYYSLIDTITLSYSNIHRAGPNRFARAGFSVAGGTAIRHDQSLGEYPVVYTEGLSFAATAKAYVPKLLPFENAYGFVYNLPTRFDFSLLPNISNYGLTRKAESSGQSIFDFSTESILFGLEVQKAVNSLYFNDLYISGGYALSVTAGQNTYKGYQYPHLADYAQLIANGKATQLDSIYLKAVLEMTPNFGMLAKSTAKFNFYGMLIYSLHHTELVSNPFSLGLGFSTVF